MTKLFDKLEPANVQFHLEMTFSLDRQFSINQLKVAAIGNHVAGSYNVQPMKIAVS